MKTKILLLMLLISTASAREYCERPYNQIGNICCPDYNNDMICDLHPTTTTLEDIHIINETHIIDTKKNVTAEGDKEQLEKIINLTIESQKTNSPPITLQPIRYIRTAPSTTSTISTTSTTNTPSTTIKKQYDRVKPLSQEENIIDKYKYHIAGGSFALLILFILFLYLIGGNEE